MMIIRSEQMRVLSAALERDFEIRIRHEIAARRPLPVSALGQLWPDQVRQSLLQGKALGLSDAEELSTFVECVLVFGPPPWDTPFGYALNSGAAELAAARFTQAAMTALAALPPGR